jgi:hypothetical protein
MQSTISLRAPNIGSAPELAVSFVGSVSDPAGVAAPDGEALCRATEAHEEEIIRYSDFAKALRSFVLADKKRVIM